MEKLEEGYCLKLKIKIVPKDSNDAWIVCMTSQELAGAWAMAISGAMSLDLQSFWDASGQSISEIKSPWGGKLDIQWDNKKSNGSKYEEDSSWNIVADWSTCSVACECGTQTK